MHEIPPNGQGIAALMALGMLESFDIGALPPDSVASQHLQIEAMKLAFADAHRYVSDPCDDDASRPQRCSIAATCASARALIDPARAQTFGPARRRAAAPCTSAPPIASGMMVSLIQSNYMGFGSGVVVPGTGISLQNRGAGFSLEHESSERSRPAASGRSTRSSRDS